MRYKADSIDMNLFQQMMKTHALVEVAIERGCLPMKMDGNTLLLLSRGDHTKECADDWKFLTGLETAIVGDMDASEYNKLIEIHRVKDGFFHAHGDGFFSESH